MIPLNQLDAYFRDLAARDVYSGVVLITRGAEPLFSGAYGYASRFWKVKNTLATRFDTASITKLFTAVATCSWLTRVFSRSTRAWSISWRSNTPRLPGT